MTFPAISLWQPWASLLFVPGGKVHETRDWRAPEKYIGRTILIHAAKKRMHPRNLGQPLCQLCDTKLGPAGLNTMPMGAFVGVATLQSSKMIRGADCAASAPDYLAGNWTMGRYAWRLTNRRPLRAPIPAIGRQGFWFPEELPEDPAMLDLMEAIDG